MPQPVRGPIEIHVSPTVLEEHPELAAKIAVISSIWAHTEALLGWILAEMLGASPERAVKMYLALTSTAAQAATLTAVASDALAPTELAKFNELNEQFKKRVKERNEVVHACWGTSPKYPGKLIRISPKDMLWWAANLPVRRDEAHKLGKVYGLKDFEAIAERLAAFSMDLLKFWDSLRSQKPQPPT